MNTTQLATATMKRPFKHIVLTVALLALIAGVSARVAFLKVYEAASTTAANEVRCPSQYDSSDEAMAAFKAFSDSYYAGHPQASAGEMLRARLDFYVIHHCAEELRSYQQASAGQADKSVMDRIDRAIQDTQ